MREVIKKVHDVSDVNAELQKNFQVKEIQLKRLLSEVDALKGELAAVKDNHADEIAAVKSDHTVELEKFQQKAKKSIATLVLQARIKIASEAQDASFNRESWDVEGWSKRLAELEGREVKVHVAKMVEVKDAVADEEAGDPDPSAEVVKQGGEGADEKAWALFMWFLFVIRYGCNPKQFTFSCIDNFIFLHLEQEIGVEGSWVSGRSPNWNIS